MTDGRSVLPGSYRRKLGDNKMGIVFVGESPSCQGSIVHCGWGGGGGGGGVYIYIFIQEVFKACGPYTSRNLK